MYSDYLLPNGPFPLSYEMRLQVTMVVAFIKTMIQS